MSPSRLFVVCLFWPLLPACQPAPTLPLIPQPRTQELRDGHFTLRPDTRVYFPKGSKDWETAALFFLELARPSTGFQLVAQPIAKENKKLRDNALYIFPDTGIPDPEGYKLEVKKERIVIRAKTAAGAFYAIQTLRQLFPPQFNTLTGNTPPADPTPEWKAPCCAIEDAPRFGWRGAMLDVGRYFFPPSFIKRSIDLLAAHKLNTFHWHLTDDQGWRIEIKKYPKLQTIGACRSETLVGHYSDQPARFDGKPYCGFYTQEEIKDVVAYAKKRFVTIVPEIEMPGHAMAALAAYPELGCTGGPYETATIWGVRDHVFCAGNDRVLTFLDDVLDEVCALFPGQYVHIGGDECPKIRWKECPKCQKRIRDEGLKDEHELQSYVIRRAVDILAKRGKKLIGWDEILEGGLAPSATVMSWRGVEGGIAAAKAGHDAVMTPTSHCYVDYYQSDPETEPLAIGGFLPLEKVYSYEPVPSELNETEARHILGAQVNLWTEYISSPEKADYMLYPRLCALAETAWTSKTQKNWPDFARRIQPHFERLDALGVRYAKSYYDVTARSDKGLVTLNATDPGMEIRYTTDGNDPDAGSTLYRGPFTLVRSALIKAAVFKNGKTKGKVLNFNILGHKALGKPYTVSKAPEQYKGGGEGALTNGLQGAVKAWERWVGLVNADIDPLINFGEPTAFEQVTIQYLESPSNWIYAPRGVEVAVSDDGKNFMPAASAAISVSETEGTKKVILKTPGAKGRYLKVRVISQGLIPEGKPGAGSGAWLFVDEVVVE